MRLQQCNGPHGKEGSWKQKILELMQRTAAMTDLILDLTFPARQKSDGILVAEKGDRSQNHAPEADPATPSQAPSKLQN